MPTGEQTQEEPVVTGAGTTIEIPPDPPQNDDEPAGGNEPANGAGPQRPSRKERREQTRQGYDAEARQARADADAARAEAQRTREELAELRGRVTAGEAARTAAAGDPEAAALSAAQKRISAAVARMGQGDASAEDDWHKATADAQRIIARQVAREEGSEVEKRIQGTIPKQMDPRLAAVVAEFPWLSDDAEARTVAEGHASRLARTERRDMNNPSVKFATLKEAAAMAAKELGLGGGTSTPTDLDRGRIAGTRGGDSGAGPTVTRVHLSNPQMKLAEQMFRSEPKEVAHAKWWKEIGSKIPKEK